MRALPISILDDIENNNDLVVGKKYNGFSERLVIKDGTVRIFNRSGSEQTANVPHITGIVVPKHMDLTLIGEGYAPSERVEDAKSIFGSGPEHSKSWQDLHGLASFAVVDAIRIGGEDVSRVPFGEKIAEVAQIVQCLRNLDMVGIHQEFLVDYRKKDYFDNIIAEGGEGVVVKKLSGYREDWFKVKKVKTWDAVIVGFTTGKGKYKNVIGAIRYGFYDYNGNLKETGKCSGMTDTERAMFASAPESFIGRVVEIKGQELGNRGGIIFPRYIRIRDDKLPIDCLLPSCGKGLIFAY